MSLSLTLTLSGGASLGAFEAGATAALLETVEGLRGADVDVSVDAFGGASAGALVAMFAAHAQLNGIDPVWLLHAAWVDGVSMDLLRDGGRRSPLGFEALRRRLPELLDPRDRDGVPIHRRRGGAAAGAVGLHIALTGLRGLRYTVDGPGVLNPVTATTFIDWAEFTLHPGEGIESLLQPAGASVLDAALASASNPNGFAPYVLDRRRDADRYRANGIHDLPGSGQLWYTDGGMLQVEPVGRALRAARQARVASGRDDPHRSVALLVDPRSELPGSRTAYAGDGPPSWLSGISRAMAILPEQILYDDLRRVEKINSRISWSERLADALAPHLDDDGVRVLTEKLDEFRSERAALAHDRREGTDPADHFPDRAPADAPDGERRRLLHELLALLTGTEGKERAEVDVISPLMLADQADEVTTLLAGEIMGDFGGFLDRDLRRSDFHLGYDCALAWLPENLLRLGVEDELARRAAEDARSRVPQRWDEVNRGGAQISDLGWRAKRDLVRLVGRMAGAAAREVVPGLRPRR